jgi:hypothetical protein
MRTHERRRSGSAVTDMLSRLRLASGMPFGVLLIVAALVGLSFIGIVGALRLRRRALRIAAAGLAVLAGGRFALGIASEVLVHEDLNPLVRPAELVGSWKDGAQALALRADRTFQLSGPTTGAGTWDLRDQELSFDGVKARVIKVNGAYRIVPSFPDDPDLWDGRLGFAREVAK